MNYIGVIVYVGLCVLIGYIGRDKKFGLIGNSLISLFLSPIVGLIVLLAQSDATTPAPAKVAEKVAVPEKAG